MLLYFFIGCKSNLKEKPGAAVATKNDSLIKMLQEIDYEDQKYRLELQDFLDRNPNDTVKILSITKKMQAADSINQVKIIALLDSSGWPDSKTIGYEGSGTIWAVLQHSGLEIQEKYFPLLQKAVAASKAEPRNAAYLEDRILAFGKGLEQKYGTQLSMTIGKNESYVMPLQSPETVDSLRSTVGLTPLSQFLKDRFNMDWNLKIYYRDLPKAKKQLTEIRKRYLSKKAKEDSSISK